jgi:hypothetical protein
MKMSEGKEEGPSTTTKIIVLVALFAAMTGLALFFQN